jgi:hypothetical protein
MPRPQPFARGQGTTFRDGPFLGGYTFTLKAPLGAGGTVVFPHALRVIPRHVEVVGCAQGAFPSRAALTAATTMAMASVMLESGGAVGDTIWLW